MAGERRIEKTESERELELEMCAVIMAMSLFGGNDVRQNGDNNNNNNNHNNQLLSSVLFVGPIFLSLRLFLHDEIMLISNEREIESASLLDLNSNNLQVDFCIS